MGLVRSCIVLSEVDMIQTDAHVAPVRAGSEGLILPLRDFAPGSQPCRSLCVKGLLGCVKWGALPSQGANPTVATEKPAGLNCQHRPKRRVQGTHFRDSVAMSSKLVLLPTLLAAAFVLLCAAPSFVFGGQPATTSSLRTARSAVPEALELETSISTALEVSTPGWWANIVTLVVPLAILITLYLQSERRKSMEK